MSKLEKYYDVAVWCIHTLQYEQDKDMIRNDFHRLAELPFHIVVEIANREGFDLKQLMSWVKAESILKTAISKHEGDIKWSK